MPLPTSAGKWFFAKSDLGFVLRFFYQEHLASLKLKLPLKAVKNDLTCRTFSGFSKIFLKISKQRNKRRKVLDLS
ncbi:hypothetical protein AZI86_02655 [Bdellovibrio bacteriovorus]|uniref:Uncharacterized protein n=1 Tax=Bdellovibrio bacteriovorus TaxID=959 RepID=A0A150WNV2_BDEBC|nr:hypothetical protein AZI86_02655 [Bdellovibrio bacteriovorus]